VGREHFCFTGVEFECTDTQEILVESVYGGEELA